MGNGREKTWLQIWYLSEKYEVFLNDVYCSFMCSNGFYFSDVLIVILWHFEFFIDFKFLYNDEKHLGMGLFSGKYKSKQISVERSWAKI